MSICSIEDVASARREAFWFQLYVMRDRGSPPAHRARQGGEVLRAGAHARPAGPGPAPQDLKNGLAVPPRLTLGTFLDVLYEPSWAFNV